MNKELQSKTILGVPALSMVFDSALTLAVIMAAISIGKISERVETQSRTQAELSSRLQSMDSMNNAQQVSIGQTEAHYSDIVRRLDSIDLKLDRARR